MAVQLLIGADVAPTASNADLFAKGDAIGLIGDALHERWQAADARIFDLEIPLYDGAAPIAKCGPALKAPEASIAGLAALKPSLVTLANNHILDHGAAGLSRTAALLQQAGLPFVGAGETLKEAEKPAILSIKGLQIGVLGVTEHEFSIATEASSGANPFDPLEAPDQIRSLKQACDTVIVLYHGGPEGWAYPTAELQKRLRKLAASGADAVLCQHGHAVGAMERYQGSVIVYGQGNFLFDAADGEPCWDSGILVELTLADGPVRAECIPIVRVPGGCRLAEGETAREILDGLEKRSEEILDPAFVKAKTRERAEALSRIFGRTLIGDSRLLRAVNAITGRRPLETLYDETARLRLYNYFGCETLRELFLTALERNR